MTEFAAVIGRHHRQGGQRAHAGDRLTATDLIGPAQLARHPDERPIHAPDQPRAYCANSVSISSRSAPTRQALLQLNARGRKFTQENRR